MMQQVDTALLRFANRGTLLPQLVLVVFTLLMILPGFFVLPPVDRDESRFSQASRQMVESGDLIDIRLGEDARYKKPVGLYWLQTAALTVIGAEAHLNDIWAYRLPSALAAVVSVLLTYLVALQLMGAQAAFLAAALLASSFVFGAEARLAKTDATLLATILICQWSLARLWSDGRLSRGAALLFWGALAASILVKGPLGPMVIGSTIALLALHRRGLLWLAPLRFRQGGILLLVLVLPWFIAISLRSGGAFWTASLGADLLAKVGEGQESHGAPPGSYLLAVWLTFWPAAILLPFAVLYALRNWKSPEVVFCLAWIIPTWLIFELAATKLLHYVLPTYPALALLAAAGWLSRPAQLRPGLGFRIFLAVILALALVFPVASAWLSQSLGGGLSLWWAGGLWLCLMGIALGWRSFGRGARLLPACACGVLSLGLSVSLYAHLARTPQLWPSVAMARLVSETELCTRPLLISIGYEEASLMLLNAQPVVFGLAPDDAVRRLQGHDCGIAFVTARQLAAFQRAAADAGLSLQPGDPISGFSIGGAEQVELSVFLRN